VLLTPLLKALRNRFRNSQISLLVSPGKNTDILKNTGCVDNLIIYSNRNSNILKLAIFSLKNLKKNNYELVLHTFLHTWFKISLMSYLTGAPVRIGFNKNSDGFLNTYTITPSDKYPEVDRNLILLKPLGIPPDRTPVITVSDEEDKWAKEFISERDLSGKRIILGIHPGCNESNKTKRWFPDRFAQIGDWFIQEFREDVILFGGPAETNLIQRINELMRENPIISVNHNIRETIALIKQCSLYLSNDSGLMHIADALLIPVIALFGPTIPVKNRPLNSKTNILYNDICSSKCHRRPPITCYYQTPKCLESISVVHVKDAVRGLQQSSRINSIEENLNP
jgi:heptosyltransferase-2